MFHVNDKAGLVKVFAKAICILGVLASVIFGILILCRTNLKWNGILCIVLGSFDSWFSGFLLNCFGDMMEDAQAAAFYGKECAKYVRKLKDEELRAAEQQRRLKAEENSAKK